MNQTLHYEPAYEDSEEVMFTYDLSVASCLHLLGHKLLYIKRSNPKRACFVFPQTEQIKKDIEAYYNDELTVTPRKLFDSQKMLKNILYSNV